MWLTILEKTANMKGCQNPHLRPEAGRRRDHETPLNILISKALYIRSLMYEKEGEREDKSLNLHKIHMLRLHTAQYVRVSWMLDVTQKAPLIFPAGSNGCTTLLYSLFSAAAVVLVLITVVVFVMIIEMCSNSNFRRRRWCRGSIQLDIENSIEYSIETVLQNSIEKSIEFSMEFSISN